MTLTRIGILMSPTGLAHPDTLTGLITNVMEDGETNSRSLALMSQAETEFQSLLTKSTSSTFHCSRYFRYWSSIFRMSLEFSMVCFRPRAFLFFFPWIWLLDVSYGIAPSIP
jgi:hypothetical protein